MRRRKSDGPFHVFERHPCSAHAELEVRDTRFYVATDRIRHAVGSADHDDVVSHEIEQWIGRREKGPVTRPQRAETTIVL